MFPRRHLAVVIANRGARAAAAAVTEQRDIHARLQSLNLFMRGERAEFNKMISAAARPKLRPGPVLVASRDRTQRPIGVHDFVLAPLAKSSAYAETCFLFDRAGQSVLLPIEIVCGNV